MLYEDCELKSVLDGILQAVPDVSSPPPVPRILLPVSDTTPARKKAKADRDITAVYAEMVQKYRKDLPAANVTDDRLCPPTRKIPLSELPQQLDRCHEKFKVVENSNLLNGAIFGQWIDLAYSQFVQEKSSGKILLGTFEQWLKRFCSVKPRWARELRYFYELCNDYPQILRCSLSLSFFSKHRVNIRQHFREDKTLGAKWSHALSCQCGQCGP